MANITPLKFSALNVPAALIWSVLVAGIGYIFADALDLTKNNMKILHIVGLLLLIYALSIFIYKKSKK